MRTNFILLQPLFCCLLQLCIVFVDSEGEPTKELSAIAMSVAHRHILDIYHAHAQSNSSDDWAQRHVHGLSPSYLNEHGFPDQSSLVKDFKKWLADKNVLFIWANAPNKERELLNTMNIGDIKFPPWIERTKLMSHQMARHFKDQSAPITSVARFASCPKIAHNSFQCVPLLSHSPTEYAKREYGYHCSLYDVFALYLHYVIDLK